VGLFNPFTFGRKTRTAWNALVGWHTFKSLSAAHQHLVIAQANQIAQEYFHSSLEDLAEKHGAIVVANFLVLGMGEMGIVPILLGEKWFPVKNPIVESIGAKEMVMVLKPQLRAQFGVDFTLDDE